MKIELAVLAGTLLSAAWCIPAALAQQPCVTQNLGVPPNANTTDKAAPFFIDTTGLDFKTQPPTRDPSNPNYPKATELADGTLPPAGAEGNFIIGPTHMPAPDTLAEGRGAEGHGHLVHDLVEGQHDLQSRPDPRRRRGLRQQLDHEHDDGAGKQVEHDRHHQPSRHLDAHDRASMSPRNTSPAPRRRSS